MKTFYPINFVKRCILFSLVGICINILSCAASFAQTSWWNDAVFYEVFVRSFKDKDGDGKGDFKGLIEKLDYLNDGNPSTTSDLGVTAIWLMPIQQSPSYHGYDVMDYRTVEQDYGTNQDFKDFMLAAHARGIKVIIDYVMNHTSSQHPWFVESTNSASSYRDWYVWQNPKPTMTGPWGQTVWYPSGTSNYYAIFWSGMPDLNYATPAVKTEMFDIARFWLEEMDVDGFRLDAVRYIKEDGSTLQDTPETIDFWKDFKTYYKSVNTDALAVGEAWTTTQGVKPYVNNNGLDFCFEFDLANAILNTANTGSVTGLQTKLDEVIAAYPSLQYGTFLTNHDMNRTMNALGGSTSKAKLAADLLLTLPGVPFIYYGEEIGMTGSGVDENKRTAMQWNSEAQAGFTTGTPWRTVNSDYATKNVESQQADASSVWNRYRNLIAIRNNQAALRKGTYSSVTASSTSVVSFLRTYTTESILVVSNTGTSTASNVQVSIVSSGIAPGTYTLVELQGRAQLTSFSVDASGAFTNFTIGTIPPQTTLIYKLKDPASTTTKVTFEVDMNAMIANSKFNPATESVDIVADFNNFGATTTLLTDTDQDGIYTVTITGVEIGSKLNFKYRINATNDGREEYPTTAYLREYLVMDAIDTVENSYQMQAVSGIKSSVAHAMKVYPVPTTKDLVVEIPSFISGAVHYTIEDLAGAEKASASFAAVGGGHSIPCEHLPSGVYQLTLTYNGVSEVHRMVVQK